MTLVVGTDEAGYGPNLGPLVVAGSLWHVKADPADVEPAIEAANAAASRAARSDRSSTAGLWADSKRVYRAGARDPAHGLAALEHGALAAITTATGRIPNTWQQLADAVGLMPADEAAPPEWDTLTASRLPRSIDPAACSEAARRIRDAMAAVGVTLVGIECQMLYPRRFNALLGSGLNKADILSQTTLTLAAGMLDDARRRLTDEPAVIWCDRHGGRKSYASLVSQHFESPLVQPLVETGQRSIYDAPPARCRIEFSVGGEDRGPVALASMTAKYVRELSMHAFNEYWGARSPGLAPTAGYPVDAARWRRDADNAIQAAGVAEDDLWRRA